MMCKYWEDCGVLTKGKASEAEEGFGAKEQGDLE